MTTALAFGLCPWCAGVITDTWTTADERIALPCRHPLPPRIDPRDLDVHRLALPYPLFPESPCLSLNQRSNRMAINRDTQMVRADVANLARAARIQPGRHVIVHLSWRPRVPGRQDTDNLGLLLKVCCDGLARGPRRPTLRNPGAAIGLDLVPDDRPQYMSKLPPVILPDGPPGMWLTVAVIR